MNHAITIGELLRAAGGILGCLAVMFGVLSFLAGGMSDAPAAGDDAGRTGCIFMVGGLIVIVLMLAACGNTPPPEPRIQTVEVDKPVATQPIKPSDIPPLPGQLPKRPADARADADIALAGRCDAIAFIIRAYPLLQVSAGLLATAAPDYPECRKH